MERGGQIIYSGPLGQQSCKLIEYLEVSIFVFGIISLLFILHQIFNLDAVCG